MTPGGNLLSFSEEGLDGPSANDLVTSFTYDPVFDLVTSVTGPGPNPPTIINYDGNGNLMEIIDAMGTMTVFEYTDPNCPGQATRVTSAFGLTEESMVDFLYDPVTCNLVDVVDPLSRTLHFDYDAAGNLVTILDAEGNRTAFSYDALNRVTRMVDATNLPGRSSVRNIRCHVLLVRHVREPLARHGRAQSTQRPTATTRSSACRIGRTPCRGRRPTRTTGTET